MCGTGSTLLAARDEGRSGVGIDINADLKKIWKKY
jgi:DNA modification methylase